MKEEIRRRFIDAGACRVGFAKAAPVDTGDKEIFSEWLAKGRNAGMAYMHNYPELRFDPTVLMEGARTVISLGFNYNPAKLRDPRLPMVARFAYGDDYHKALRRRLRPVCREMEAAYGCRTRICVDSAPVRERYWAVKSGMAFRGRNGLAIIEGIGSYFFIVEVITDMEIEPDAPAFATCLDCGRCVDACPTGALAGDGTLDARHCLSYLTIEHRGEWPAEVAAEWRERTLFGCDRCQQVCPHNAAAPAGLPEFSHPEPDELRQLHRR